MRTGHLYLIVLLTLAAVSGTFYGCFKAEPAKTFAVGDRVVEWREDEVKHLPKALLSSPPDLGCGQGHTQDEDLRPDGASFACLNERGRYDGPSVSFDRVGQTTVFVRGQYREDAPDGMWVCQKSDGERLSYEINGELFALRLWGVSLEEMSKKEAAKPGRHLGPAPNRPCIDTNWPRLIDENFNKLAEVGIVTDLKHEPATSSSRN